MLAAVRTGRPATDAETLFEAVAERAFRRLGRNWKPGTLARNRHYLRKRILPRFAGRQVAGITRRDVRDWFASMHATPVSADRSMPVLSVVMKAAEADGLRPEGSNPCRGIRRYRRRNRERFLSGAEFARLGRALREAGPSPAVPVVRLLALTGCRSSEIRTLRWTDFRDGHVYLRDGKTGPGTVWLSSAAPGRFLFPSPRHPERPLCGDLPLWNRIRRETGIEDVRLHDLRHSYASQCVIEGVPLPVVSRLLGHSRTAMTLRYVHAADRDVAAAAERVGARVSALLSEG